MFSLSFAVVALLITVGINGQSNDIDASTLHSAEKGFPFGKLRLSDDGKTEELIPASDSGKPQISQDQSSSGVQPLPSPCIGTSASTRLAYPKDKTKYIQCRDEFHYEIYTCPNAGHYNEQTSSCDVTISVVDKCEEEKPCLNDGKCTVLSDSTFKCVCRADWTGERCETPLNSCVKKPCGPNADCRSLKTIDYEQDYVCICHGTTGYGLNCQEAVSNPCLTTTEQFFPYAFSQHAYIQCDGDLVHFQPCGSLLYWNQEEKICDRKRPAKIDLPALMKKYAMGDKENQQEKQTTSEDITSTTTQQTEQQNQFARDNEVVSTFVPARVANRQQLLANINNQQSINRELEQNNQDRQTQSIIKPSSFVQSEQNQPWSQNTQQQWKPTLTGASSIDSNTRQSFIKPNNIQQNFFRKNQIFNNQQQLMQDEDQDKNVKGKQFFGNPSQSWQGSQSGQLPSNAAFQQGVQNQNPSWQSQPPQSIGFQSQNTQGIGSQTPSWQNPPTFQNQQSFQNSNQKPFTDTATVPQNVGFQQGLQTPGAQFGGVQSSQSAGFPPQNTQNFGQQQQQQQQQPWQGSQTFQQQFPNPHQQPFIEGVTLPQNGGHFQGSQQNPSGQPSGIQSQPSVGFPPQNTQNFGQQSWQGSQTPGAQFGGAQSPGSQFGGTQSPGAQFGGAQTPGAQFGGAQTPGAQFGGVQSPGAQFGGAQSSQSVGFPPQNTQNFGQQQQQPWQGSQTLQNQQQFQNFQNPGAQFSGTQSPGFPSQSSQNFGQQPWQKSQGNQNQTILSKQIPPPIETTTVAATVIRPQVRQNSSVLSQDQPSSMVGFNPQPFIRQQQSSRPDSQLFQNQQQFIPSTSEGLSVDNNNRLNTAFQNQQSWQNKPNNFVQSETSLIDIERPPSNNEQSFAGQPIQNQLPSSSDFKNGQWQKGIQSPIKQQQDLTLQNQAFANTQRFNPNLDLNRNNNQRFGSQSQSWQGSQTIQNQQPFVETTTIPQNVNRVQGLQNSNTDLNQVFAFQPRQWQDTSKQTQQSLNINPSSGLQNTQFGLNQQQTTNDHLKPQDPLPTIVSGSWQTRS